VAGLVEADLPLTLEDRDREVGVPPPQFAGGGEADNPCTYQANVTALGGRISGDFALTSQGCG
jgi:hypothetical protein